jgi:hypothetical protein
MADEKGVVTIDLIMWVAGTLIAVMVFVGIIWPWLLGIWYGSCWTGSRTDLRSFGHEIEGGVRGVDQFIDYDLSLGTCIAGVVFINSGDARNEYYDLFKEECGEYSGYKSYMVAIPSEYLLALKDPEGFNKEFDKELETLKDSMEYWSAVKLWIKDQTGRVPSSYCYEFEHSFSYSGDVISIPEGFIDSPLSRENWNRAATEYCLRVTGIQAGDDYTYRIDPRVCPVDIDDVLGGGASGGGGAGG